MSMYYLTNQDLYHHGILGMKWGIRRYQPYPKGYSGSGKEVGEAAKDRTSVKEKVKNMVTSEKFKKGLKMTAKVGAGIAIGVVSYNLGNAYLSSLAAKQILDAPIKRTSIYQKRLPYDQLVMNQKISDVKYIRRALSMETEENIQKVLREFGLEGISLVDPKTDFKKYSVNRGRSRYPS